MRRSAYRFMKIVQSAAEPILESSEVIWHALTWYSFYTTMSFEFDPAKSAANKTKHGIDFVEAQALWLDPDRIEVPARPINEPRLLVIGKIAQTTWTATVTYRHENTIRLISVRRARQNEEEKYREDDHG